MLWCRLWQSTKRALAALAYCNISGALIQISFRAINTRYVCRKPIRQYERCCQVFPASHVHHHSWCPWGTWTFTPEVRGVNLSIGNKNWAHGIQLVPSHDPAISLSVEASPSPPKPLVVKPIMFSWFILTHVDFESISNIIHQDSLPSRKLLDLSGGSTRWRIDSRWAS